MACYRPEALRAAFDAYRAIKVDDQEDLATLERCGKGKDPVLTLAGERSFNR